MYIFCVYVREVCLPLKKKGSEEVLDFHIYYVALVVNKVYIDRSR